MEEIVISENVQVYETLQDSRVFISSYFAEINENIHRNGLFTCKYAVGERKLLSDTKYNIH